MFQTVLALQRLDPSRDVRQTFMQVIERQQNEKEVERNIIIGLQGFKKGSDFKSADGKLNAYLTEVAGGNRLARELFEPQIIAMAFSDFDPCRNRQSHQGIQGKSFCTDQRNGC